VTELENVDRAHFLVLTGHLDDQPLADLFRTLRAQRKSGRLQVEYPDAPGAFFFEEGQLVDAWLGELRGVEAVHAALALPGASFNFNPLVRPPDRGIDRQQQKFIADVIESHRLEALPEIEAPARRLEAHPAAAATLPRGAAPLQLGPVAAELIAPLEERLAAVEVAIDSATRRLSRERMIYVTLVGFLLGIVLTTAFLALYFDAGRDAAPALASATQTTSPQPAPAAPTVQQSAAFATTNSQPAAQTAATSVAPTKPGDTATSGGDVSGQPSSKEQSRSNADAAERAGAASSQQAQARKAEAALRRAQARKAAAADAGGAAPEGRDAGAARGEYAVYVLMEVENGRVKSARVMNPRAGAGDYESLALRMARQRRYPESFTGSERLRLKVRP
jgi:hypothetical protein